MSIWNWAGIITWLVLLAYFFWMISNVHSRKKKLIKLSLSSKNHLKTPSLSEKNSIITALEVIVLVVFSFGLYHAKAAHHINNSNSRVITKVSHLQLTHTKQSKLHPNAKVHYFYVESHRTTARDFKQKYNFMTNGAQQHASSSNAILTTNPKKLAKSPNLPYKVQQELNKKIVKAHKSNAKPWALQIVTQYKGTLGNGLGLHAGRKAHFYTIINLPSKSDVYQNNKKIMKLLKKNETKAKANSLTK